MAAFNWQAMLQSLGGMEDPNQGIAQLAQRLTGGNIPQGNPLDPGLARPSAMAAEQPPVDAPDPRSIVVNANNSTPAPAEPATPPNMGNRDFLDEAAAAGKNSPKRSGMFGTKGTVRDILGILGDAFLVQSGNKPIYHPQRQAEKEGDAMAGFTQDPLAALERLAAGGFGTQARDLSKDYNTNQAAMQTAGRAASTAKEANYQKYGQIFGQYMGAATPETWSRVVPLLKQLKERGGLGEEFQIPEQYDDQMNKTYQYGGMPATRQVQTEQFDRKQTETERHNRKSEDTSRISATRPRAERASPNPTAASIAAPLLNKVSRGETLTTGERETLDRTAPVRGGKRRAPPPLPPGFGGAKRVN